MILRLVSILVLALWAGCSSSDSTGPTIDPATALVVAGETLVPVGSSICHIAGTVQNVSGVKLNVELRWEAFDATGKSIGKTGIDVDGLAPGETRAFDATGFLGSQLIPCSAIARFQRTTTVST